MVRIITHFSYGFGAIINHRPYKKRSLRNISESKNLLLFTDAIGVMKTTVEENQRQCHAAKTVGETVILEADYAQPTQ